jgi:hypothetical protein
MSIASMCISIIALVMSLILHLYNYLNNVISAHKTRRNIIIFTASRAPGTPSQEVHIIICWINVFPWSLTCIFYMVWRGLKNIYHLLSVWDIQEMCHIVLSGHNFFTGLLGHLVYYYSIGMVLSAYTVALLHVVKQSLQHWWAYGF